MKKLQAGIARSTANLSDAAITRRLTKLYQAICFEPGTRPPLRRLRKLFAPGGRLAHVKPQGVHVMSLETFITQFTEQVQTGRLQSFHEREVAREIQRFGNIAHVFSTYEARWRARDMKPFACGINSIQLWRKRGRWLVTSLIWDDERAGNPIPARFLPKRHRARPKPPAQGRRRQKNPQIESERTP